MQELPPPRVLDTLWLIRHLATSARGRRLPAQTRKALATRGLSPDEGYQLLRRLASLLPEPLTIAPPCCTLRSRHETIITAALAALEAGEPKALLRALQSLAAPLGMSVADAERARDALARLAGYDGSMRCRYSNGNGGDAMALTASDTSATALSSPATRLDFSSPQR